MMQIPAKARDGIHQKMTAKWGFLVCLKTSATNRKLKNTLSAFYNPRAIRSSDLR